MQKRNDKIKLLCLKSTQLINHWQPYFKGLLYFYLSDKTIKSIYQKLKCFLILIYLYINTRRNEMISENYKVQQFNYFKYIKLRETPGIPI